MHNIRRLLEDPDVQNCAAKRLVEFVIELSNTPEFIQYWCDRIAKAAEQDRREYLERLSGLLKLKEQEKGDEQHE